MNELAYAKYDAIERRLTTGIVNKIIEQKVDGSDVLIFRVEGYDVIIHKSELGTKSIHAWGNGQQTCYAETVSSAVAKMHSWFADEYERLLDSANRQKEHMEAIEVQGELTELWHNGV